MRADTGSMTFARQGSTRLVIERLLRGGPTSRAKLARSTGLSKQTISCVMRDLERDGWVHADGHIQGAVGRSAVAYAMRADAAFVLGIDLGGTKLHVALADMRGQIIAETVEPTAREGGIGVVEQIGRITDALGERADIPRQRLLGAVMGSPGIIDPASGAIVIAPNIPGFDEFGVQAALCARLGLDIDIENDVNLAAIGENWRGNTRRARTFVIIAIGTGIGMGIFADGHLVRGSRGAAGEIAYLPLGGDPYDSRGHRLGTLETAICSAAISDRYVALGGSIGTTVRQIFERLGEDQAARLTVHELARIIATAILAVKSVIDPEVVVMGGSIGIRPELTKEIEAHLARCTRDPVQLEISALGSRGTLVGALGSAIDKVHHTVFGVGGEATTTTRSGVNTEDVN